MNGSELVDVNMARYNHNVHKLALLNFPSADIYKDLMSNFDKSLFSTTFDTTKLSPVYNPYVQTLVIDEIKKFV